MGQREDGMKAAQLGVGKAEEKSPGIVKQALGKIAEFPGRNLEAPPALGAQMGALFRTGRDDLLNTLYGATLTSTPGEPATPTQFQTNQGLDVYGKKDTKALDIER